MDFAMQENISLLELLQTLYLILSLRLSFIIHKYSDPLLRKWMGTVLGLISLTIILNTDVWHHFAVIVITIWMMILIGPKYSHIVSFCIMFTYLIAYRMTYYLRGKPPEQVLTVVQSIGAMMVTGVGFEINLAYKRQFKTDEKFDPTEDNLLELNFLDIFHYIFNYATVCTGPYVRYQVYSDFINLPFSRVLRRSRVSQFQICILAPFCLFLFALLTELWPIQYIFSEEFYERCLLYRLNYCILQWLRYRIFLYSNFGIIRCYSVLSGIGAYPVENKARSAHGPTVNNNNLRKITLLEAREKDLEMNTTVIADVNFETLPTIKEATKHWNMSVQYWLEVYIYKSLPKNIGRLWRILATLVVSTLWHGIHPSLFLSCTSCAYYYYVEMLYIQIQKQATSKLVSFMNVVFWISRQYFWGWAMMGYFLLNMDDLLQYYTCTFYIPLIFTVCMHMIYVSFLSKHIKQKHK